MAQYEWLSSPDMLAYVDALQFKLQYTSIIILDNRDYPIAAITGRATGGSISANGASSVRKTGTLTIVAEQMSNFIDQGKVLNEVTNVQSLISINKRCSIEVGIVNNGGEYRDIDIFWFPLGTFTIINANVSNSISGGISISLQLKDKMTLLNGELGGTIPISLVHAPFTDAAAPLSEWTEIESSDGSLRYYPPERDVFYYDLIESLITNFSTFTKDKLVIEDIPRQIKNLVRWQPITVDVDENIVDDLAPQLRIYSNGEQQIATTLALSDNNWQLIETYDKGEMPGYVKTDFIYPTEKEFATNAGESVTSALDKLKNSIGNFEYFIDDAGLFRFREIRNYVNSGSAFDKLGDAIKDKYFTGLDNGRATYDLTNMPLLVSANNNPQYQLIKNDFVVWGKNAATEQPIQYRLTIEALPNSSEYNFWYIERDAQNPARITKAEQRSATNCNLTLTGKTNDEDGIWRIKKYLLAIESKDTSQYAKELIEKVPQIWETQGANIGRPLAKWVTDYTALPYWVDAIDTRDGALINQAEVAQFGIEKIGRRTKVINDDNVNCLFATKAPEVIFCNAADYHKPQESSESLDEQGWIDVIIDEGEDWTAPKGAVFVSPFTYADLALGTKEYAAYDRLRSEIHTSISYNNNINLSLLPIYHLEVNQRIKVRNDEADIYGDYIINSIQLPLALNGTMTISATRAVERI